jgi:hypothetical protein
MKRLAGVAMTVLALGCYEYVPTTVEAAPGGARVRAMLTADGRRLLEERFQVQNEEGAIEGELLERSSDQVRLFVPSVPLGEAYRGRPLYQQVELPAKDILRLELRKLDRSRTGLLVGGVAALATAVTVRILTGGEPGRPPGDGGEPAERIAPGGIGFQVRFP